MIDWLLGTGVDFSSRALNKPLRELLLLVRCASVDCVIPVRPGATKSLTQLASLPPDLSPFSFLLVSADSAQLFYYRHSFRRVLPDSWASAHRANGVSWPPPPWKTHHTHTHTRLTAIFPGLPRWAGTRKAKPIWILLKQETVSGSGISWNICESVPKIIINDATEFFLKLQSAFW